MDAHRRETPAADQGTERRVYISRADAACDGCGKALGHDAWITVIGDRESRCLACARLDHLTFLPSGDAALTRRAAAGSTTSVVVLRWSRARKRYERQGTLVEEAALEQARAACRADEAVRAARRRRAAERRPEEDRRFVEAFTHRVREVFPGCPDDRARAVAEHACRKHSGRVGRSAAAKRLDEEAVRLAVGAHVRHAETDYDRILDEGGGRREARREVRATVDAVLAMWRRPREEA